MQFHLRFKWHWSRRNLEMRICCWDLLANHNIVLLGSIQFLQDMHVRTAFQTRTNSTAIDTFIIKIMHVCMWYSQNMTTLLQSVGCG